MSTSVRAGRRLSLAKVAVGAFVYAWQLRAGILRQAGLAMAAQVLLLLVWTTFGARLPSFAGGMLYAMHLALVVIVAVKCHRLVLVKGLDMREIAMPLLEMRELKFLLAMLVTWIPAMAVMMFSSFIVFTLALNVVTLDNPSQSIVLQWVAWVPAGYVAGRLCLKMPAAAIDRFMDIASALAATRGNGWKLVIVVSIIPWLISQLSAQMFSPDGGPALMLISCVAAQLLVAVEVMALSIAYQELAGPDGTADEVN